jgi:hypothetical protein
MVEDTKEDKKSEPNTPLLSANLSYPTRPYVAQIPALIRIVGHYADFGRPMPKAGSPEAETAVSGQQENEKDDVKECMFAQKRVSRLILYQRSMYHMLLLYYRFFVNNICINIGKYIFVVFLCSVIKQIFFS